MTQSKATVFVDDPLICDSFGKLLKIESQAVTAQISGYTNVVTPDDYGAEWQVRAMLMFMFPRSGGKK